MIKPKEFIAAIDDAKVIAAIQKAEQKTSSEFRVFVANDAVHDPVASAKKEFARLKMHGTKQRNAVLLYVAPRSRNFAIYADSAAHENCGQATWDRIAGEMGEQFKQLRYTEGLVQTLVALGEALALPFPRLANSGNQLSDTVERG